MKGYSFRSLTDLVLKIFKTKVNAGTGLSGGGSLEADRTLSVKYGTAAGTAAQGNDGRLSNSREWIAATIPQAETEAGTATTRRAFTAQRVRQAIVAWWNSITGVFGRDLVTSASNIVARSKLGLGTAATYSVGEYPGQIIQVGAFGLGTGRISEWIDVAEGLQTGISTDLSSGKELIGAPSGFTQGRTTKFNFGNQHYPATFLAQAGNKLAFASQNDADSPSFVNVHHSGNLLQTTGSSTEYPMSQKATTDQLATKASTSTQVIAGTGLTGGGSLSANRTLNTSYGTTAGTSVQGNDSRVVNALQRGNNLSDVTNSTSARSNLGLGTAATLNVGESRGQVMQVGAFGVGIPSAYNPDSPSSGFYSAYGYADVPIPRSNDIYMIHTNAGIDTRFKSEIWANTRYNAGRLFFRTGINDTDDWTPFREIHHTGNLLQSTGSSTEFPISQKATTDALNTKAALSHTHPWSQITAKPAQATRWPTFAEVTGKPTTYAPSSHTHPVNQVTGLGTAATLNVGESRGQVMQVGAFGVGTSRATGWVDTTEGLYTGISTDLSASSGISGLPSGFVQGRVTKFNFGHDSYAATFLAQDGNKLAFASQNAVTAPTFVNIHHSGNFNPNSKANTSTQVIAGTGLTGGGTLAANRSLSIAASHIPLGVGQTWRDVISGRSLNTTYTNTTGRPIQVSISVTNGANVAGNAQFVVDGITIASDNSSSHSWSLHISAIIPAGLTYSLNSSEQSHNFGIRNWAELR